MTLAVLLLLSEHFRLALKIEKEVNTVKPMDDFIDAPETAKLMRCSVSHAYKILAQIRKEMKEEGLITLPGKVPRQRFMRRVGLA
jgi:hypothetical protein